VTDPTGILMFFRFSVALGLVVLVSLAGTTIEKRNLALRRTVSRQHYRLDVLNEQAAQLKVEAARLGAPARLIHELPPESPQSVQPSESSGPGRKPNRQKRHSSPAAASSSAGTRGMTDREL
jgi:hypothetical protein